MEKARDWEHKLLVNEVIEGLESAKELPIHLDMSSPAGLLVKKIQSSLTNALSILKSSGQEVELPLTGPKASSSSTLSINKSLQSEDSNQASNDMGNLVHCQKRRKPSMETKQMRVVCSETDPPDDGYIWRKHGQKEITGSRFPRSYYRSSDRYEGGCTALKTVLIRSHDDPSMLDITYQGKHTCEQATRLMSLVPLVKEQEQQQQQQTLLHFPMEPKVSTDVQIPSTELSLSCFPLASLGPSNPNNPIDFPCELDERIGIMDEVNEDAFTSIVDFLVPESSVIFSKKSSPSHDIPHVLFERAHRISVLDLSHTKIEFLPESISELKNVQKLLFHHCERLKIVPYLAKLKELRVLDLSYTIIKELPLGIDELVNLKHLDLSYTRNLEIYPVGVLHKLPLLEDLLMFQSRCSWPLSDVLGGADIKEIVSATHLANLAISFVDLPSFIGYMRSGHWRTLKSFRFDIGWVLNCLPLASFSRKYSVQILGCDLVDEMDSVMLPDNTLELIIKNCHGIGCLSEMQCITHLRNLKECSVVDCDGMECILMVEKNTLPTMEELILYNLPNLRTLYRGVPQFGTLPSLKTMTVEHCHNLKNLFSFGLFQHLQNLEYVRLWMCDKVEEIIAEDEVMADRDTITLPRLKELRMGFLPELRSVSKRVLVCNSLVSIVVENCPKLKKLPHFIGVLPSFEKIRGSRKWWDALEWDDLNIRTPLQTFFIEQSDLESESEFGSESEEDDHDEDDDGGGFHDDDERGDSKRRKVQL
ncbi:disease resistance protein At4g27190-like [Magnolia sinica]|uniref:disease resistance protein At4g27190-like n=1 Tax=Magnolia sinica TaxID=86752 RepID=UPI00265B720F|nr:disease resistance protein At4g27190-like [Magnolia sinica]